MPEPILPTTAPGQERSDLRDDPFGLRDRLASVDHRIGLLEQRIAPLYAGGGLLDPQSTITAYDDASPRAFIGQAAMIAEGGSIRIVKDNEFLAIHAITACYDYIVESGGNGTHLTLEGADGTGALKTAVAAGGDKTIFMCNSETLPAVIDLGTTELTGIVTIVAASYHTVITAASGEAIIEGGEVTSSGDGFIFRDIGLATDAGQGVYNVNDAAGGDEEIDTLRFYNCEFACGTLLTGDSGVTLVGVNLLVEDCRGSLDYFYIETSAAIQNDPKSLTALNCNLTMIRWWHNPNDDGTADDTQIVGGLYSITTAQTLDFTTAGGMRHMLFHNLTIEYSGAGALWQTSTGTSGPMNISIQAIEIRFSVNAGTAINFPNTTLTGPSSIFIDGLFGFPAGGVTPSGTFVVIGTTDVDEFYIGDIYGRGFSPQYTGPVPNIGRHATIIQDTDGDTKVDVEESADEDIIRFDIAGTERMTLDATKLDLLNGTYLDANDVRLPLIGSPTYTNLEDMNILFHSAGWFSGGVISDAGSATINVTAGTGALRSSDSAVAPLLFFDWPASNGLAITTDSIRYIGVELNDPNDPQIVVRTSDNFDHTTDFPLGTVVNEADTLHVQNAPWEIGDHANTMIQRLRGLAPIARDVEVGGIIFSETGTRNIVVSAGQLWRGLTPFVIGALDTDPGGAADTFDAYSSQGKENTGIAAWPNTLYDNGAGGTGTLQTLGNNKWANLWWYIELDGELVMIYGTAQYTTQAQAEAEAPPSTIPNRLQVHGVLAARFIFKESAATAAEILSAFDTTFTVEGVTDHSNLAGVSAAEHATHANASIPYTMSSVVIQSNSGYAELPDEGGTGNIIVLYCRVPDNWDGATSAVFKFNLHNSSTGLADLEYFQRRWPDSDESAAVNITADWTNINLTWTTGNRVKQASVTFDSGEINAAGDWLIVLLRRNTGDASTGTITLRGTDVQTGLA